MALLWKPPFVTFIFKSAYVYAHFPFLMSSASFFEYAAFYMKVNEDHGLSSYKMDKNVP